MIDLLRLSQTRCRSLAHLVTLLDTGMPQYLDFPDDAKADL
jgi:hypothetical protein